VVTGSTGAGTERSLFHSGRQLMCRYRMIAIFDEDGGGDVDFQEFVSGLSAFSSKGNKEQKLRFAFKVYDIDRDGYISNGELFIVLKMMVGSNLKDQQLQQVCTPYSAAMPWPEIMRWGQYKMVPMLMDFCG
jgi:hypothetical protein